MAIHVRIFCFRQSLNFNYLFVSNYHFYLYGISSYIYCICSWQQDGQSLEDESAIPLPQRTSLRSFSKTLTPSDTSTHGGFSVPKRYADECLPPLVRIVFMIFCINSTIKLCLAKIFKK